MTPPLRQVEELALTLPAAEREELATRLLRSLDDAPLSEVDEAWVQEAERRFQDLVAGKVKGIPGHQVISDIRRELGWQT